MHLKEFFRPAQVDSSGDTNNVAFGEPGAAQASGFPAPAGSPT